MKREFSQNLLFVFGENWSHIGHFCFLTKRNSAEAVNLRYEPNCASASSIESSGPDSSESPSNTFNKSYFVFRWAGVRPASRMKRRSSRGWMSCPYWAPAEVEILSFINVPPTSFAPADNRY